MTIKYYIHLVNALMCVCAKKLFMTLHKLSKISYSYWVLLLENQSQILIVAYEQLHLLTRYGVL
jgi:hypothetical protein